MGYIAHHAIVVTCWSEEKIKAAHDKATKLHCLPTPLADEQLNGFRSFLIPPDGSKEGWEESDAGDARRSAFKKWLRAQAYADGSSPFEWFEAKFGNDDRQVEIIDNQWRK